MNNSIVKLEDFELDEISGGVTAKQVAKKAGAYAIKGTVSAVFGSVEFFLSTLSAEKFGYFDNLYNFLNDKIVGKNEDIAYCIAGDICLGIPSAFAGVAGWELGGWICKKIGLED